MDDGERVTSIVCDSLPAFFGEWSPAFGEWSPAFGECAPPAFCDCDCPPLPGISIVLSEFRHESERDETLHQIGRLVYQPMEAIHPPTNPCQINRCETLSPLPCGIHLSRMPPNPTSESDLESAPHGKENNPKVPACSFYAYT